MKRGHIITCLNFEEYSRFINEGFVGLFPIKVDLENVDNVRSLSSKTGTNGDIIDDLKRVKDSDYFFLHTIGEEKIYGPYESFGGFKETLNFHDFFKSQNL